MVSIELDSEDSHYVPIVMDSPKLMPKHRGFTSVINSMESIISSFNRRDLLLHQVLDASSYPVTPRPALSLSPPVDEFQDALSSSDELESTPSNPLILASILNQPLIQPSDFSFLVDSDDPFSLDSTERHLTFNLDAQDDEPEEFYPSMMSHNAWTQRPSTHLYIAGRDQQNAHCAICLEDFKDGELLKTLPCMHLFHNDHISRWLEIRRQCPLCKRKVERREFPYLLRL